MKLSNTALFYRMEREKAMYWLSTKKAKIIMLLPTLMIYAVFIIIPVFIAFYYSFTDYSGLGDRKSTRLNSSHRSQSRMPSSA